jgi:hypothetical protein
MKKMFAVLLAMLMLLGLCACGNTDKPQETTAPIASDAPATEPSATEEGELDGGFDIGVVPVEPFVFTFNGVTLIPGTVYDAAPLPEPTSVY